MYSSADEILVRGVFGVWGVAFGFPFLMEVSAK